MSCGLSNEQKLYFQTKYSTKILIAFETEAEG